MSLEEKLAAHRRARAAIKAEEVEASDLKKVLLLEDIERLKTMAEAVEDLRKSIIARAILDGVPGKEIAELVGLTAGRISQIKNEIFGSK